MDAPDLRVYDSLMKQDVELISIGSELLSGRTLNSHAQTLGAALTAVGLRLSRDTTIPDVPEPIQSAVSEAFERVDIVVVSGGLGPTVDDLTRDALAALLNREVVMSAEGLEALRRRYAERGRPVTPAAERQALVLDGAVTLVNSVGMAPGERIELPDDRVLFVIPGPPNEFAAVLNDHLVPWFREAFGDARPLEERVVVAKGIGESDIVTRLEDAGFHPGAAAIGFYPGGGLVEIRLSAPQEHSEALGAAERSLRELLHGYLL